MSGSKHIKQAREPEAAPARGAVVIRWDASLWRVGRAEFDHIEKALRYAGPRNFIDSGPERITHVAEYVAAEAEDDDS